MALYSPATESLCVGQQTPRGMAPAQVIRKVRLEPRREEADCVAHEHDLVAGSLSGIYGRNRKDYLSVLQLSE